MSEHRQGTTQVRVAKMSERERQLVNLLTSEERLEAMVIYAIAKVRKISKGIPGSDIPNAPDRTTDKQ